MDLPEVLALTSEKSYAGWYYNMETKNERTSSEHDLNWLKKRISRLWFLTLKQRCHPLINKTWAYKHLRNLPIRESRAAGDG